MLCHGVAYERNVVFVAESEEFVEGEDAEEMRERWWEGRGGLHEAKEVRDLQGAVVEDDEGESVEFLRRFPARRVSSKTSEERR